MSDQDKERQIEKLEDVDKIEEIREINKKLDNIMKVLNERNKS